MYNNGDYGASFHYMYVNHHTVTVGQYQGTLMSCHTVNITYMLTLLVYAKAIKFIFSCLNK